MQIAVLSSESKCCKMEIRKLGGGIMSFEFKEIAGKKKKKRELIRLCEVIKDRDKYARRGGRVPKGIIFYGATGMGKTMFARAMANACGLRIVRIDAGNITNGHALCKRIRRAFSLRSKRKGPAMILFDEIDKVLPNRREEYCTDQSKMILTQLLTLIDGLDCGGNFVFVATCNDYMALPRALVRPGRIDKKICLGMPTLSSRTAILDKYISETECRFEEPTAEIAKLCTGFSCATLKTFVNECVFYSDENAVISARAVRNCIAEIRNENLIRDVSAKTAYINACHNLGCFLVARSFQNGPYVIDLKPDTVCNDFFNAITTMTTTTTMTILTMIIITAKTGILFPLRKNLKGFITKKIVFMQSARFWAVMLRKKSCYTMCMTMYPGAYGLPTMCLSVCQSRDCSDWV